MPQPWEKYQQSGQPGPWARYQRPAPAPATPTLQERAKQIFGFEDYPVRGTLLPLARTAEGEVVPAWPQIAVDMAESALLPGHAMQQGRYTPEDVLRFTLDYAAPMTAGRSVGAGAAAKPNLRRFRREAPSTEALKTQARSMKNLAKGSGVQPSADSYFDMLSEMEGLIGKNKINPTMHPRAVAAMKALSTQIGDPIDVEDMIVARRLIHTAQRTTADEFADERRIASLMEEHLDNWVDNLKPSDLVAGDATEVGKNLRQFRRLWWQAKKSELVEDIIDKASLQASGFENGIRIGFRQLLKDKKRIRGFTDDERKLMARIVEGAPGQKLSRLLGKLSFGTRGGSNFLGGTIGVTAGSATGSALGGPTGAALGAVLPPLIGYGAQKGADISARRGADLVRALSATGGKMPRPSESWLLNLLMKSGAPTVGALPGRPPPALDPNVL